MACRVLIEACKHETIAFSRLPTELAANEARALCRGEAVRRLHAGTSTEFAAFLDGCRSHGWDPLASIVAEDGGITSNDLRWLAFHKGRGPVHPLNLD
jgi:hypothetical protein